MEQVIVPIIVNLYMENHQRVSTIDDLERLNVKSKIFVIILILKLKCEQQKREKKSMHYQDSKPRYYACRINTDQLTDWTISAYTITWA